MNRCGVRVGRWVGYGMALFVMLLIPAMVLARAGGGEGFSGGGGSGGGGGGGGGSDGGGDLLWLVVWLLLEHPVVGIPLLLIVAVGYALAHREGVSMYQGSVIRRGGNAVDTQRKAMSLASLQEDDPAFSEAAFLDRAKLAFLRTQAAWAAQDLSVVRAFLSDGVYERFSLQFAEQKAQGYRNAMEQVRVLSASTELIELDENYQMIAVRIRAYADDYYLSLEDGRRLPGPGRAGEFSEIWSFLRRRGVRSGLNGKGLIEGHCPNCGAAIEMNQNANCHQCGSLLRSGQYDWVLTEITQDSMWSAQREDRVPGLDGMKQRDPAFARQSLEDTASVAFWRLLAARRLGKVAPIRKMATDGFCDQLEGTLATAGGERSFYMRAAVGGVNTLAIQSSPTWDRAVIEVVWSAEKCSQSNGQVHNAGPIGVSRMLMVLVRRPAGIFNMDHSVSSAHCPNCGAPESDSTSNACESCGTVLNDGTRGWVLMEAHSSASQAGMALLAGARAQAKAVPAGMPEAKPVAPGGLGMLAWMVKMAVADGTIGNEEQRMLREAADRWGIPLTKLEELVQAGKAGTLESPVPRDSVEARGWVTAAAAMALADGRLDSREAEVLAAVGKWCGLSPYDLKVVLNQTRREMYADARQAMRGRNVGGQ